MVLGGVPALTFGKSVPSCDTLIAAKLFDWITDKKLAVITVMTLNKNSSEVKPVADKMPRNTASLEIMIG